jgi:hypothetical protein
MRGKNSIKDKLGEINKKHERWKVRKFNNGKD